MVQMTAQANPLKQYFRTIKLYMKLPTGTSYYPPGVIELNEQGEVGIMAMTGKDELALKNPDALLNGEALIEVFNSCVPALKQPRLLATNDIDAMITAIRYATYNDSLETEIKCPKCGHDNLFKLNLQYAIDNMEFLESEYVINLESGLSVFLRPYAFPELLKSLLSQFEQTKLARAIESQTITDADRSAIVKKAFKELAVAKFDMLSAAVARVVDEANGIDVSNREHIKDFLQNIDTKSADAISSLVTKINAVGIKRTFDATCEKCEHTWESEIDFNPVNFS